MTSLRGTEFSARASRRRSSSSPRGRSGDGHAPPPSASPRGCAPAGIVVIDGAEHELMVERDLFRRPVLGRVRSICSRLGGQSTGRGRGALSDGRAVSRTDADRRAAAIIAGFLVGAARLSRPCSAPGSTRATRSRSREPSSLSYFDHPPLHQWIAHFAALALGEGVRRDCRSSLLFAATGWIYYRLSYDLFGAPRRDRGVVRAQRHAVLLRLRRQLGRARRPAAVWPGARRLALARIVFPTPTDRSRAWLLWLLAGFGFGLAGLVEIQRRALRRGPRRLRRSCAPTTALAPTSRALCGGRARAGDDRAGHRVERRARLGVVCVSGFARSVRRRV